MARKKKHEFNYAVGHYWPERPGSISCYTLFSEVHFGSLDEAKNYQKYVKKKSPDKDWKIFMLVEVPV